MAPVEAVPVVRWTDAEAIRVTQKSMVQSGRAPGVETTRFKLAVVPLTTKRVTVAARATGADNPDRATKPRSNPQVRNMDRMFIVSGDSGFDDGDVAAGVAGQLAVGVGHLRGRDGLTVDRYRA